MEFNKIHRKQDLNVFYHVCVFRADRRNKIAAPACDWLRHFRFLLWNHWIEFNKIWQDARSQCPLISLRFSGRSEEQDGRPTSDLPRHFDFSSVTAEQDSTKLDRKQNFNVLYQVRVIRRNLTGSKISMSYTNFFSGRSEKQDGCPGLWLTETFSTSPLNGIQQNLTGNKICHCHLPSLCFSGRSEKHCTQVYDMWPLGLLFMYQVGMKIF